MYLLQLLNAPSFLAIVWGHAGCNIASEANIRPDLATSVVRTSDRVTISPIVVVNPHVAAAIKKATKKPPKARTPAGKTLTRKKTTRTKKHTTVKPIKATKTTNKLKKTVTKGKTTVTSFVITKSSKKLSLIPLASTKSSRSLIPCSPNVSTPLSIPSPSTSSSSSSLICSTRARTSVSMISVVDETGTTNGATTLTTGQSELTSPNLVTIKPTTTLSTATVTSRASTSEALTPSTDSRLNGTPVVFAEAPYPSNLDPTYYNFTRTSKHSSAHFTIWNSTEKDATVGLSSLEGTYDCFIVRLGWLNSGVPIYNDSANGPFYKTSIFSTPNLPHAGASGVATGDYRTGLGFIFLLPEVVPSPAIASHEAGHVMNFAQQQWWNQSRPSGWAEMIAQYVNEAYVRSPMCAQSRALVNQTAGFSLFRPRFTTSLSYKTIIDATDEYWQYVWNVTRDQLDYDNTTPEGPNIWRVQLAKRPLYMGCNIIPLNRTGSTLNLRVDGSRIFTAILAVRSTLDNTVQYTVLSNTTAGNNAVFAQEGFLPLNKNQEAMLVVANTPDRLLLYDIWDISGEVAVGLDYSITVTGAVPMTSISATISACAFSREGCRPVPIG